MKVAIVGQGYVGLPLAIEALRAGHLVFGVESNTDRHGSLRKGESYIPDVASETLKKYLDADRYVPVADVSAADRADVYVIAVPTSSRPSGKPDLDLLDGAVVSVSKAAQDNSLVVIESTVEVGATRRHVAPLLEAVGGRQVGRDIFLAYSPERIDPGRADVSFTGVPKLVSGLGAESGILARKFYETMFDQVHLVSSCEVAEFAKLFENSFRYLNIAFVNELARAAHAASIDFREVVTAAASKPYGFMPFYHGPGVGGHCLPNNVRYLNHSVGASTLLEAAMEINEAAPRHVVDRIGAALRRRGRTLAGASVLVVGIAYKANVPDVRASPVLEIIRLLRAHGVRISVADPLAHKEIHRLGLTPATPTPQECRAADLVLIATDHRAVDYPMIVREAGIVLDCRGRVDQPTVEQF